MRQTLSLRDAVLLIHRLRSLEGSEEELNQDIARVLAGVDHADPLRLIFESERTDEEVARTLLRVSPGAGAGADGVADGPSRLTHRSYAR